MGSYSSLSIDNKEIYCFKNYIIYDLLNLFSPNDYIEEDKLYDDEIYIEKKFKTNCKKAKKRLDIIGYDLKKVIKEISKNINMIEDDNDLVDYFFIMDEYNIFNDISISKYLSELKKYINKEEVSNNKISKYISKCNERNGFYGFPIKDILDEVRLILEVFSDDDLLEYDLTELIDNEYIEHNDIFEFWNYNEFSSVSNKTIILAEGKTDIFVLKNSLQILYPEYADLYVFFDFNMMDSPGSTNQLVNLLKGFINCGIGERIIAIFDNDTAAYEAQSNLDNNKITNNIRIMNLPYLKWAESYPTLGPTGEVKTNINGMACSIELFMGRNLLTENNSFIPIQWTGYSKKLNKYQGEILYKSKVNEKFREVIKKVERDGVSNVNHDWEPLKYLWENIFNIFNYDKDKI